MSSIFTKKKFFLISLSFLSLISIPLLILYAKYNKRKEKQQSGCDDIIICDCCGEWKPEKSTVNYIYNDTKYTVCPTGQATDTKELEFALSKNKYLKLLYPF